MAGWKVLFLFVLCMLALPVCGEDDFEEEALNQKAKPRKKRLVAIEEIRARQPLLYLDAENYERFVHKGPRPYHVVVFAGPFSDPKYAQTKSVIDSLTQVSDSYEIHLQQQREQGNLAREVVFVLADTKHNPMLIEEHGLKGDVVLFLLRPTQEPGVVPMTTPDLVMFNFRQPWNAASLIKWIHTASGVSFKHHTTWMDRFGPYLAGVGMLFTAVILIRSSLPSMPGPTSPKFWFGACIFVWMLIFSGIHYCVIREVPPFGYDPRSKSTLLFHPNPSSQFALEGLIMAALELTAAMMLVALVELYPYMNQPEEDKKFLGFMFASATGCMFLVVRYLFFSKQRWL